MHRLDNFFGSCHGSWIKRRAAPGDVHRQACKVDDGAIATVAAQIERGAHENAVHRTGFHAQGTEHALRIIDGEPADLETFAVGDPLLPDVDAVDRAGLGALVTGNAGGQVIPMKTSVSGRHRCRQFGVLKVLRKRPTIGIECAAENLQRHAHAVQHRADGSEQVAKPADHGTVRSWVRGLKAVLASRNSATQEDE